MNARVVVSIVLAYLVPGAGHFYLGRRARAAAFFCIVMFLFALGFAIDGGVYALRESRGSMLKILASLGSMGGGLPYLIASSMRIFGDVMSPTYEYGKTFTLSAGLMNLLLMVDCFDIATGRKS